MATVAAATTGAGASEGVRRGFSLLCPRCLEQDTVRVDLDDLGRFTCTSCEEEFQADDVRAIIDAWTPALAFLASAPVKE